MKYSFLLLFLVCACTITAGRVPEKKNPDVVDKYYEGGYSVFSQRAGAEKLSVQDFATKACVNAGFKKYSGYKIDRFSSGASTSIGGFALENSQYKEMEIWCE
jgi:hypothetical protein